MIKSDVIKGYLLISVTVLGMANVYVFSKAAMNIVSFAQFGFYWFIIAFLINLAFNRKKLSFKTIDNISKKGKLQLVLFSLFELFGTITFFLAIKTMSNPALVSFLANLTPVFVTFLGLFILKERFIKIEILGVVLTISRFLCHCLSSRNRTAKGILQRDIINVEY